MKRVQVYYNIRRGDYSVRQSGRVIDHVERIVLRDVRFNVAPAGRDKVRATGVKNVRAILSRKRVRRGTCVLDFAYYARTSETMILPLTIRSNMIRSSRSPAMAMTDSMLMLYQPPIMLH